MTTGTQCRADPRCEIPAPAETGLCHCHAKQAANEGVMILGPCLGDYARSAWARERDEELEP